MSRRHYLGYVVLLMLALAWPVAGRLGAQRGLPVQVDGDDLGGVVSSPKGPEAGVWVIAETRDLPTRFTRVVVTDDQGRFLVPDLPKASYRVWVRGYGLVDSPAVLAGPGQRLDLTAVPAPTARAAAEYYPANYWMAMLTVPAASEFPGTGPSGNGIPASVRTQAQYVDRLKTSGCQACHQLGNKATREMPAFFGSFPTSAAAWERRLESGQPGAGMGGMLNAFGRPRALAMFADWTDRIAAGEVPPAAPPRPQGVERNVVLTHWEYGDGRAYIHDAVSTDKRQPTVNGNGPLYGASEVSSDDISVLDPVRHTTRQLKVPVRDEATPDVAPRRVNQPSAYWGEEVIWQSRSNAHSPMLDRRGRLWTTSSIRPSANPAWCRDGSSHPSARLHPIASSGRQASMHDPATGRWTLIDTCFPTHHLQFADDANDTLWFSTLTDVIGWIDTKAFERTGDAQRAQGWTALVLDVNGNGRRDADVTGPDQPLDPLKDRRVRGTPSSVGDGMSVYSLVESPADTSIWAAVNAFPGFIVRLTPGANPPATALAEVFEPPFERRDGGVEGVVEGTVPRGIDVDRNGVVWTNLSGSSHLASFDRRKCRGPLNGPTALGRHCPEGWALHALPGPQFRGVTSSGSADATYYVWVDQFDTFGMGANLPMAFGNGSDSLHVLTAGGQFTTLRVPYPMGFYAKGMDGRIDDPKAGWKGRGLWASSGTRAPWHQEGGRQNRAKLTKFQFRPHPLDR